MPYDFEITRKGYNTDEVDRYIEQLEKELNEYKEKTSTINKAIINAQIAADNIIKAAHSETEKILTQAKKDADELKTNTIMQIRYLKLNIANQKNLIENFRQDYAFLTEKYLNPIATADTDKVFESLTAIETSIDELSNFERRPMPSEKKVIRAESDNSTKREKLSSISENIENENQLDTKEKENEKENALSYTASLTQNEISELLS